MAKKGKIIDEDRCYFNPATGDKIYSHYTDGTEIKLSPEDKKKADAAIEACIKQSIKMVEEDPKARAKPLEKRGRGRPKKIEEKKE